MRPTWDKYFMDICDMVATRSTCDRKNVGTVIVKDKRILTTGYNGSVPGLPHCDDFPIFQLCPNCNYKNEMLDEFPVEYNHCVSCYEKLKEKDIRYGDHDLENNHCVRVIHSEVNAITQAAYLGVSTKDATLYCNTRPCYNCLKTIIAAGINRIVFRDSYGEEPNDRVSQAIKQLNKKISFEKLASLDDINE